MPADAFLDIGGLAPVPIPQSEVDLVPLTPSDIEVVQAEKEKEVAKEEEEEEKAEFKEVDEEEEEEEEYFDDDDDDDASFKTSSSVRAPVAKKVALSSSSSSSSSESERKAPTRRRRRARSPSSSSGSSGPVVHSRRPGRRPLTDSDSGRSRSSASSGSSGRAPPSRRPGRPSAATAVPAPPRNMIVTGTVDREWASHVMPFAADPSAVDPLIVECTITAAPDGQEPVVAVGWLNATARSRDSDPLRNSHSFTIVSHCDRPAHILLGGARLNGGRSRVFAHPFGVGDVISMRIDFANEAIEFAQNGVFAGAAFATRGVQVPFNPIVYTRQAGISVRVVALEADLVYPDAFGRARVAPFVDRPLASAAPRLEIANPSPVAAIINEMAASLEPFAAMLLRGGRLLLVPQQRTIDRICHGFEMRLRLVAVSGIVRPGDLADASPARIRSSNPFPRVPAGTSADDLEVAWRATQVLAWIRAHTRRQARRQLLRIEVPHQSSEIGQAVEAYRGRIVGLL